MLDMMSNLLAERHSCRILHRWHSTAVLARANRGEESHRRAKLQHAIYKSTKLLKLKETQSVAQSMKKWWKFMLNDCNKEAKLNMACRRIYSYFSALAKANTNQAFLRMSKCTYLCAS